jgi:hypothetical protein
MKAGNLKIRWNYSKITPHTFCKICNMEDRIIGAGYAICAKGDCFCKETGRKISLARAMKQANLPKEERKVLWEIYRNTKLGGRW